MYKRHSQIQIQKDIAGFVELPVAYLDLDFRFCKIENSMQWRHQARKEYIKRWFYHRNTSIRFFRFFTTSTFKFNTPKMFKFIIWISVAMTAAYSNEFLAKQLLAKRLTKAQHINLQRLQMRLQLCQPRVCNKCIRIIYNKFATPKLVRLFKNVFNKFEMDLKILKK